MKSNLTMKLLPLTLAVLLAACVQAPTQDPAANAPTHPPTAADVTSEEIKAKEDATPESLLKPLSWLTGCWKGSVNNRDYREHWLPLRGDMLLGASHTVVSGKTQDYQFLRMEIRDNAINYVIAVPDEKEHRFKLKDQTKDQEDTIFTFNNVADVFPQTVLYRQASKGWMYITIEGKLNGQDRKVIYPIHRVDCATSEVIEQ